MSEKISKLGALFVLTITFAIAAFIFSTCSSYGTGKEQPNAWQPTEDDNPTTPTETWNSKPEAPVEINGKYLALTTEPEKILNWAEQRNVKGHIINNSGNPSSTENTLNDAECTSALVELDILNDEHLMSARSVEGVLAVVAKKKYIASHVECSRLRSPCYLPNDPFFIDAKTDDTTEPPTLLPYQKTTLEPISIEGAWDSAQATDIRVAVISSGVYESHPDLTGRISSQSKSISEIDGDIVVGSDISEPDSATNGATGTYLAGIIAANMNNSLGIAGIAPECELIVFKTGHIENLPDPTWVMSDAEIIEAIDQSIAADARVILLPLAVVSNPVLEPLLEDALARCASSEILVVVPAGDGNPPVDASQIYPANSTLENVIVVGGLYIPATTRLSTSNLDPSGTYIDIAAPGFALVTTDLRPEDPDVDPPITGYVYANGTAISAALVTGTVALIASAMEEQQFQIQVVRNFLLGGIDSWADIGVSNQFIGAGRLNVNRSVMRAYAQVNIPSVLQISQFASTPTSNKNGTMHKNVYISAYVYGGIKPYTVRVDWGDGTSFPPGSSNFSPFSTGTFSHAYIQAGIFPVIVTFKDATGQERAKATTFKIMRPLTATISAEPNTSEPRQYLFTASYLNTDRTSPSFAWDFDGDWEWDSHEQNPVFTFPEAGAYTINFQMADNRGTISRTMDLLVE